MKSRDTKMAMRKLLAAILAAALMTGATACQTEPSDLREVKRMLSNTLSAKVEYRFQMLEKNRIAYLFRDENGVCFSVDAWVTEDYWLGGLGVKHRGHGCDYYERLLEANNESIRAALAGYGVVRYVDNFLPYVAVGSYADLENAAEALCAIKDIAAGFPIRWDRYAPAFGFEVVTLSAERTDEDGRQSGLSLWEICYKDIESFPERAELLEELRREYVDRVKLGEFAEELPDEILEKYPASRMKLLRVGGAETAEQEYMADLFYDRGTGEYFIKNLSLWQVFDHACEPTRGLFRQLVQALGGVYRYEGWKKASWEIGGDLWTAEIVSEQGDDDGMRVKSITVRKNGAELDVAKPDNIIGKDEGVAYTFADYPLSDLEKLLGAKTEVDHKEMAVRIVR
ncbi:MAG: hypothetical protein LBG71_03260 [Clostridiales Family XIII bacterium]|nr:hypothetical protein [Clostridiales Family XIII bacterium]